MDEKDEIPAWIRYMPTLHLRIAEESVNLLSTSEIPMNQKNKKRKRFREDGDCLFKESEEKINDNMITEEEVILNTTIVDSLFDYLHGSDDCHQSILNYERKISNKKSRRYRHTNADEAASLLSMFSINKNSK